MSKEIEYKALISKEEYERLLSEMSNHFSCRNYVQTNYYYDTEKLSLYHRHETLRIRKKDESLQLEYKFNKKYVKQARICEEKCYPIKSIPKRLSKEDIGRCGLPDLNYNLLGSLVTNRSDFVLPEGVLFLDQNEYLGYVDYEVELEFTSLSLQVNNQYLGQHRTIAEASAVESPIRQETIGFPAHFFARAHNFKPPGRACQPEADSPMRT